MVKKIYDHFQKLGLLTCLNEVSHNTCDSNGKDYVDLDAFFDHLNTIGFFKSGDKNKSCDTLLFNLEENHLLLVEFKRFNQFEGVEEERVFFKNLKTGIYLKMSESLLILSHYFYNELNISQDDFFNISKSFILVYRPRGNKELIHKSLYSKTTINRNKYLFKNIQSLNNTIFEEEILSAVV